MTEVTENRPLAIDAESPEGQIENAPDPDSREPGVHDTQETTEEPDEYESRGVIVRSLQRTGRIAGRAALVLIATSAAFAASNHGSLHLIGGLFATGEMTIPNPPGCAPYEEEPTYTEPAAAKPKPVATGPPSGHSHGDGHLHPHPRPIDIRTGEPVGPSTLFEAPKATPTTTKPEDRDYTRAAGQESAAFEEGKGLPNVIDVIKQYWSFGDLPEIGRHVSQETGIEYVLLQYGEGSPDVDVSVLDQTAESVFGPDVVHGNPELAHAMDCVNEGLFGEEQIHAGRVIPVIIPGEPACYVDFKLTYLKNLQESQECHEHGFTMPRADINFLGLDLSPLDEFVVVTSGSGSNHRDPAAEAGIQAHEIFGHKWMEIAMGDDYILRLNPDEALAQYVESKGNFACIMPFVVYGNRNEYRQKLPSRCIDEITPPAMVPTRMDTEAYTKVLLENFKS